MDDLEAILNDYIKGNRTGEDNMLKAAAALLEANRTKELSHSLQMLHQQIPIFIKDLKQGISNNTDKMVASNEKLQESNEDYAKWMKRLTFALVFVGVAQVVVALIK